MALDQNVPLASNTIAADLIAINANWEAIHHTIFDDAGTTQIQTEESAAEAKIRFDIAGTEMLVIGDGTNEEAMLLTNGGTADALKISQDAVLGATQYALWVYSNQVQNASPLVFFEQDNAGSDQNALRIQNDGTGSGVLLTQNGGGVGVTVTNNNAKHGIAINNTAVFDAANHGLYVYSDAIQVNAPLVFFEMDNASDQNVLDIQNDGTGDGLWIDQNGNGVALHIDNDGTANSITVEGTTATDFVITKAGNVFIGDSANAGMTLGLTVNQGANDDEAIALKSSDVAHGYTTGAETDTYASLSKSGATSGGLRIRALKDADGDNSQAITIQGFLAENVDTTKSTFGRALVEVYASQTSGNALVDVVDDGNVFGVLCRTGSATATLMIIDENGEINAVNGTVNAFDKYDDAALIRAFDVEAADPASLIQTEFDKFISYNKKSLEDAGILGKVSGENPDEKPLYNINQLQKLHNGAIWQGRLIDSAIVRTMVEMIPGFKDKLQENLNALNLPELQLV